MCNFHVDEARKIKGMGFGTVWVTRALRRTAEPHRCVALLCIPSGVADLKRSATHKAGYTLASAFFTSARRTRGEHGDVGKSRSNSGKSRNVFGTTSPRRIRVDTRTFHHVRWCFGSKFRDVVSSSSHEHISIIIQLSTLNLLLTRSDT